MAIKYLYIDDEKDTLVDGIKDNLSLQPDRLVVDFERALGWDKQIDFIINSISNYDGILLDLKLDFPVNNDNQLKYYGADLAQAIKTLVKTGVKITKDIPIMLCSTDSRLKEAFDGTSSDLFDRKYNKETDFDNLHVIDEFISFADAYDAIRQGLSIEDLLKCSEIDLLEVKLHTELLKTPHEKASFIFNNIVQCTGLLVDENILAIRLGIDKNASEDWVILRDSILDSIKYNGIYSNAFPRWWSSLLLNWWKNNVVNKNIQGLGASERVIFLKQAFKLEKLIALELPINHIYDTFWYKCHLSNTPLETADGLKTIEAPRYNWQEPSYISMGYITSEERDRKKVKSLLGTFEAKKFDEILKKQK